MHKITNFRGFYAGWVIFGVISILCETHNYCKIFLNFTNNEN